MPAYRFANDFAAALREIEVHADCLRAGNPPPGQVLIGRHEKTSVRAAADVLGCEYQSLIRRIGTPAHPGGSYRHFRAKGHPDADKLLVDWSLFQAPPEASVIVVREPAPEPPPVPEAPPADPIELRRAKDRIASLEAALKEAERRAADAEDIRGKILGLTTAPLRPRISARPRGNAQGGRQAVILHLSDLHAGEVISAPEILGANRYDMNVFRARLARYFLTAADLVTDHWPRSDEAPNELVVCLGGDLVSGSIHPELAETNEGTDYEIFREVAERIAGGIAVLREKSGLPIRVFSVPGNHGRQNLKPQAKRQGLQSWDILVADFAEAALKHDAGVTWFRSDGSDCYFDVVGWPILLTHGHVMGTGGGQGFAGPMLPIIRGHRKTVDTEFRQRRPVYMVLSGHFHTTGITPFGAANGSLVGYGEYARTLRADPEPAKQNLLVLHERRGLIRWHPVYVGDPSEGSLYQGFSGWLTPQLVQSNDPSDG